MSPTHIALFAVQLSLALVGLAAFAFAPPVSGAMLLVPLTAQARANLPALAIDSGVRLLGQGPVAGSLVVRGDRARLGTALLRRGIVPLAAPEIICGRAAVRGT